MKLVFALLALAVAGGCGGQQPDQPGAPKAEQLPAGRTFTSTQVTDDGKTRTLAAGSRIRLAFDKGEVRADAGCNQLSGDARLDAGRLTVSELSGTEMACDKPLMDQDQWLSGFLTSSPVWQLKGDTLTLSDGTTRVQLREQRDRTLTGGQWTLDTLVDGQTASSLPQGVKAHLNFNTEGKITGNTGCNHLGGGYTEADGTLTFDTIGVTKMACGGAKDTVEKAVLAVLDGTVSYRIDGETLILTHPSGKGLRYRAS
ncbi:MAG: META domain-containing protein [Micromonosporaceae bacterium]